ncbi:hypothetical protein DFR29_103178 [Tahibacter aquaticus]|uniref:Uncharacterized protein n=1 Tax=Tahibacter aquaticus TaxID=520092 RepID=A0A4R6Z4P3_9GAMM|nr:hypothetical protein DFR29_103178 [Tahibacter aquaticus]
MSRASTAVAASRSFGPGMARNRGIRGPFLFAFFLFGQAKRKKVAGRRRAKPPLLWAPNHSGPCRQAKPPLLRAPNQSSTAGARNGPHRAKTTTPPTADSFAKTRRRSRVRHRPSPQPTRPTAVGRVGAKQNSEIPFPCSLFIEQGNRIPATAKNRLRKIESQKSKPQDIVANTFPRATTTALRPASFARYNAWSQRLRHSSSTSPG